MNVNKEGKLLNTLFGTFMVISITFSSIRFYHYYQDRQKGKSKCNCKA